LGTTRAIAGTLAMLLSMHESRVRIVSKPRHELRRRRDALEQALFLGTAPSVGEVRAALSDLAARTGGQEPARVAALEMLARGDGDRLSYIDRFGVAGVRRFRTGGGRTLYQLGIETFPDHVNNVYLLVDGSRTTLYDCGSQMPSSRDDLRRADEVLRRVYGESATLDAVQDVVISHAHIDHFGGVSRFRSAGARIYVHEFDARVVSRFEERVVMTALEIRLLLERAGVSLEQRTELEQMYVFGKHLFSSVPVDETLVDGATLNGCRFHHVPGHCPGQLLMQVDDVLLTADHVLARITPHQAPESITPWTGLDHYFQSLAKIRALSAIRLALAGHEEPITDLQGRIDQIVDFHRRRLEEVRQLCAEPKCLLEISNALFGGQMGYGRLLALEEAGAHVEYLTRHGQLAVANFDQLLETDKLVLLYQATS
jgi:glyoxylase-like metal-dependent hydrolase (beta-lactamase superfamily II)